MQDREQRALATPRGASTGAVTGSVRMWLRAEGLAVLAASTALYASTGSAWGLFAVTFLAPDLALAAYLAGARVGASVYNAAHSYVGPLGLIAAAWTFGMDGLLPLAAVWAAHVGFDRLLGYGLKYPGGFGDTHLGRVGRASPAVSRSLVAQ